MPISPRLLRPIAKGEQAEPPEPPEDDYIIVDQTGDPITDQTSDPLRTIQDA